MAAALWLARNCTIRRPEPGQPPAILTLHALTHAAAMLRNGRVLVTGGINSDGISASAEVYNPNSGTWTTTGSLNTERYAHTATLLRNGMVLVAGGLDSPRDVLKRRTVRSGEQELDCHRQSQYRTLSAHGNIASKWRGPCRGGTRQQFHGFAERRTVQTTMRAGDREARGRIRRNNSLKYYGKIPSISR